jgi:DNA-binding beta-propeller fold protein YncE
MIRGVSVRQRWWSVGCLLLASCGGGGDKQVAYTVGGTVTGLAGPGLVLSNNGAHMAIATNGAFSFPDTTATGTAYKIAVLSQPTGAPAQNCTVANASGSGSGANIDNVSVVCANIARFAYVSSGDALAAGRVSGYLVDSQSGALLPMSGSPFAAGADYTAGLAVHPSGRFLYAINTESISAFSIDASTGVLHTLAGSPFGFAEFSIMGGRIAIDPSGSFLYVTTQNGNRVFAFAIDAGTGQLQELASIPLTQNAQGGLRTEAIDAAGKYLYVADPGNSYIAAYTIEPGNGALAAGPGGPFPTPSGPTAIAADPTAGYVYVTSAGSDRLYAFAIDSSSGALTSVPAASIPAAVNTPLGTTTDARGRFLFVVTRQLVSAASVQYPLSLAN